MLLRATQQIPSNCSRLIEEDNPDGDLFIITDNLSSHNILETRTWLADHPRLQHIFIPKGACPAQSAGGVVAPLPP